MPELTKLLSKRERGWSPPDDFVHMKGAPLLQPSSSLNSHHLPRRRGVFSGNDEWHLNHTFGRSKWIYVAPLSLTISFLIIQMLREGIYSDMFSATLIQVFRGSTGAVTRPGS